MKRTESGRDALVAGVLSEQVLPLEKIGWTTLSMRQLKDPENNPIHALCTDEQHTICARDVYCVKYPRTGDRKHCHRVRMVELRLVEDA